MRGAAHGTLRRDRDAATAAWRRFICGRGPRSSRRWRSTGWGSRRHRERPGDRCLLYYNQPRRHPNFLALKYIVSHRDCTLATVQRRVDVLDEVARIKRSDAILCDVWNARISDRLLARWGWEPHSPSRWHRHYIKRFYGVYPAARGSGMRASQTASRWPSASGLLPGKLNLCEQGRSN